MVSAGGTGVDLYDNAKEANEANSNVQDRTRCDWPLPRSQSGRSLISSSFTQNDELLSQSRTGQKQAFKQSFQLCEYVLHMSASVTKREQNFRE